MILNSPGMAIFFSTNSYAQEDQYAEEKEKCEEDTSKAWSSFKNRCMTKEDVYQDRAAFRECEKIKGAETVDGVEVSEEARKRECFDNNAAYMVGDLTSTNSSLKGMQTASEAIGYIQMMIELIAKDGAKADCNSSKVMAASGIIGLGVDIYLTFFVEDELHKLQDKYAKEATKVSQIDKGAYEAQIEAFNYLQKEQETLISIDEKKIIAYGIMTGLNGLAMLLAIYEMTPFGAAGACKAIAGGGEDIDIPDKPKDADADVDTPDAPDEISDAPDTPKGDGPDAPPEKPKSDKFKESATDVKDKKKVLDKWGGGDVPDKKPSKFKDVATDVKIKKKTIDAFTPSGPSKPKAPDFDAPTKPKDPGNPPNSPGDPPTPPTKPSNLSNPSGDVPPPPKRPGDPPTPPDSIRKRPTNPGDPGDFPPTKPGDTPPKNPGDKGSTNPGNPPKGPGKKPQGPGDPPRPPDKPASLNTTPSGVDTPPPKKTAGDPPEMPERPRDYPTYPGDPGTSPPRPSKKAPADPGTPPKDPGPPKRNPGDAPANPGDTPPKKASGGVTDPGDPPKKPKGPTPPEKPPGLSDSARDGDWVKANIDAVGKKKKDVSKMSDTEIDNMDVTRKQKQDMKDLRAKKKKDLQNIKTQKKKYGPDADVGNLERDIVKYDKQSFDMQNKSQLNEVGKQRKLKTQYDSDMAVYNRKKANYDSKSKSYDIELESYNSNKKNYDDFKKQNADYADYKKQKSDFDNYESNKTDYDSYAQKKTDYDSYQQKKTDFDSYQSQKSDFDSYQKKKSDLDSWESGKNKHDSDVDQYNKDYETYNNDFTAYNKKQQKYDADFDNWKKNQEVKNIKDTEYKQTVEKYDSDMDLYNKDMTQFKKDKKKYELDRGNYNRQKQQFDADMEGYNKKKSDFDNYNKQKSDFDDYSKQKSDFDDYSTKKKSSDDYDADMEQWTKEKKKYELANTNYKQKQKQYDADMDQYNKDYDTWQSNEKVSKSQDADFQASEKKYDSELEQYNTDKDAWTKQKKKYELDRTNYKRKRDQFDSDMEDYNQKQLENDYKKDKYEKDAAEWEENQKKAKDDADADADKVKDDADKTKDDADADETKDDADADETKDDADETKDDADETKDDADADKEKDRWSWDKYWEGDEPFFKDVDGGSSEGWKEGARRVWEGVRRIFLPGARVGTRISNTVKTYTKDGEKVDHCDPEKEEGCRVIEEEKRYERDGESVDFCDPQTEEKCRVILIPKNEGAFINRKKKLDFSDPTKLMETFFNHDFEKSGLTNIEDALMLDKEWKGVIKGNVKSPSLKEYSDMQKSGMFGKNPEMANLLYNVLVISRSFSKKLYNAAFPVANAQSSTTPDAVDTEPKNSWEEETDDEEDAENKKKREQDKGKQAGIMLGSAAGGMLLGIGFEKALDKMGPIVQKVRTFFGTSPGIAILSGMGTLINGLTLGFVVKEKKAFQENLEKIDEIKQKFESDMAEFCPKKDDRENQAKPNCYCYSFGGKRNPLRGNSQICQSYWARFDAGFYVGAGKYEYQGEKNIKGCVDMNGNYDWKCNCRSYKNRDTGENSCFKTKTSFDGLGNLGSSTSTGVLTGYGNSVAQDPATLHNLNGDSISRSAVKLKNAGNKALKGFNLQRAKEGKKPLSIGPSELSKFADKVMAMPGSRSAMSALAEAKQLPARPPMKAADDIGLKGTQKKLDLDKVKYESTKKKTDKKVKEEKKVPAWDFEMSEEEKAQGKLEFMDKKYDYKKGVKRKEVVDKKSVSIFKVISNRYINTGLKLLFEK